MLVPPDNFALVEDGIFRCSKLDPINHSFLDTLNLKSVVWMDEERPTRMVAQYLEERHIKLFHLFDSSALEGDGELNTRHTGWMVLRPTIIAKVFQILLNTQNHSCLLMDKSEVVVGILRHIEKWCYSSIANEYRLYSMNKDNYSIESFLELINVELLPNEKDEDLSSSSSSSSGSGAEEDDLEDLPEDEIEFATPSNAINIRRGSSTAAGTSNAAGTTGNAAPIGGGRAGPGASCGISALNGSWTSSTPAGIRRQSSTLESPGTSGAPGTLGTPATLGTPGTMGTPGTLGTNSQRSSISGSAGLSMSTSPQVPKNLLKLVEDRRKKKQQAHQAQQAAVQLHHHKIAAAPNEVQPPTGAGGDMLLPPISTTVSQASTSTTTTTTRASSQSGYSEIINAPRHPRYHGYHFYLPKADFHVVNDRNHALKTTIQIRLPPEVDLPSWFKELRDSWEEEYEQLNRAELKL